MGSGSVIKVPSFIRTGSGIKKLNWGGGGFADTQSVWRCHKSTFISSK
jgi:hypothetical protein